MSDQLNLPEAPTYPWVDEEKITPMSGRTITLRYRLVRTATALAAMRETLEAAPDVAWDTETSGLNPFLGARICGHAFACQTGPAQLTAWYVPFRHLLDTGQLDADAVNEAVRAIVTSPGRVGYAHAKFEWLLARADDIVPTREPHDVLVMAQLANENEQSFGLKKLAGKYCLKGARDEEKVLDDWMRSDARSLDMRYRAETSHDEIGIDTGREVSYLERFGYARSPIELCGRYACKDVFYTLYLWLVHYRDVPRQYASVYSREMAVQRPIHEMEWTGLPVDIELISDVRDMTAVQVRKWLARVREILGDENFLPTTNALRALFYEQLALDPVKHTKRSKLPSTDRMARKLLATAHPEYAELMHALDQLADASKCHSTYAANFVRYYSAESKRIYPNYNMLERRAQGGVPVTGRLSSQNPNAQNITSSALHMEGCGCRECASLPGYVDTNPPLIVEPRRYFKIPEGFIRYYIDFGQIELRVLAWLSQDENLLRAYQMGLDVHQMTADLLGIDRRVAKQANFGVCYGMTHHGLAERMPGYFDNPEAVKLEAQKVIAAFFARYSDIRKFRDSLAARMARSNCAFVSPFGRPRRIADIRSPQRWERERALRQMMSSIVSGSAADLCKEAMLRTTAILREQDAGNLVQAIHDELVFDVPEAKAAVLGDLMAAMTDWPIFKAGPDGIGAGIPIEATAEQTRTTWADKTITATARDGVVDYRVSA
jgi:DNA polymerase-1